MNAVKEIAGILLGKEGQGTLKAHMVRGTAGTFALKVVNTILAFGTSLLLARLLGAKEYGVYAYAISWASLLAVPAVMGLNTLLVREVAKYKALEDWGPLRGILRWSDRVVLATSIGLAALFALIVWALQGKFEPEVKMALWLAMALVPLLSFLLLRQGGLQGLGHVVEAQVPQFLILPSVFLVLTFALYFTAELNGPTAVGLRILAGLVAVAIVLILLDRRLPRPATNVPPVYRQREWLRSALPLLFVGAAGIINQRVSTVMVGGIVSPKAAGILDIALKASILVNFTQLVVSWPLAPVVVDLYTKTDKKRLQQLITKSARVGLFGALVVAVVYIGFGRHVLLIFGKEFTQGTDILLILALGQLISASVGPVILLLNMTGYEKKAAGSIALGTIVNVILGYPLILLAGTMGAAIANMSSTLTWSLLLWFIALKKLGINTSPLVFAKRIL